MFAFILYPLQVPSALVILFFSFIIYALFLLNDSIVAANINSDIAFLFRIMSIPIFFSIISIFSNYLLLVLDKSMQGERDAPIISGTEASFFRNAQLFRVLVVGYSIFFSATWINTVAGDIPALLILLIGTIIFPAVLINIVHLERLPLSISPKNIINVFKSLGWVYLAITGLFYLCFYGLYFVFSFESNSFIVLLITSYLSILAFYAVGLLIEEYASTIELAEISFEKVSSQSNTEEERPQEKIFDAEKRADEIGRETYRLCKIREFNQACVYLEKELAVDAWKLDSRIFEDLKSTYHVGLAHAHSRKYVERLIQKNKIALAWKVCEYNLKETNEFHLKNGEDILALTQLAFLPAQNALIKSLIDIFIKNNDSHYLNERLTTYAINLGIE